MNVWEKRFKLPQLTHDSFLTIDHSCKTCFWYLPNWTFTDLCCVVLYVTYSTTHQRSVEVQFGRYQKNILQEWCRVKKLSCVSCGSLKRFPHTFTSSTDSCCYSKSPHISSYNSSFAIFVAQQLRTVLYVIHSVKSCTTQLQHSCTRKDQAISNKTCFLNS